MDSKINGSQAQTRNSSIELLRIICMLFVLGLHANYLTLGSPSTLDAQQNMPASFLRIFMETLCIVAVNTFVFISGWFAGKFRGFGPLATAKSVR